jgi:hypothetical protein
VRDGLVVLNGRVGSLSHKRLAGVLAWWYRAPGHRERPEVTRRRKTTTMR